MRGGWPKKALALPALLAEHWEAIEADFASEYPGIDLLDLHRGTLSLRRAAVLVSGLKPGSRLGLALGGDMAWSDEVATMNVQAHRILTGTMSALGVPKSKLPKRIEPPEPGWQAKAREQQELRESKRRKRDARQQQPETVVVEQADMLRPHITRDGRTVYGTQAQVDAWARRRKAE